MIEGDEVITTDYLMRSMLSDSCPNSGEDENGYESHTIELHCMVYEVKARVTKRGVMDQETGK